VLRQRSSQPTRRLTRWSFILLGQRFTRTHNPARRCMRMQASTTQSATALAQPTHSLPQVMNADRFDGPYANLCDRQPAKAASSSSSSINNSGGGSYSNSQVRMTDQYLSSRVTTRAYFLIHLLFDSRAVCWQCCWRIFWICNCSFHLHLASRFALAILFCF